MLSYLVSLLVFALAAQPTVAPHPTLEIAVPISVNLPQPVGAIDFSVYYDANVLEFMRVTPGVLTTGGCLVAGPARSYGMTKIAIACLPKIQGTGAVAHVVLRRKATAQVGRLSLWDCMLDGAEYKCPAPFCFTDHLVECPPPTVAAQ